MMKIWMPTEAKWLNPYTNGKWVEGTDENKKEAKKRWKYHREIYAQMNDPYAENRDIARK